jgi:transcriptional regulator with XRE-family HTH domain
MDENNLNIAQLATKVDIPRTSINNWLNHESSPKIEYLCALATFFNCSVDYLLGLEDEFGNKKQK